jgi:hypothetical protein
MCGIVKVVMAVEVGCRVEVSEALGTSFHEGRMVLSLVDPHGLFPVNKELILNSLSASLAAFFTETKKKKKTRKIMFSVCNSQLKKRTSNVIASSTSM